MPTSPRPAEGGRRREGGEEGEGDVAVRSGCPFARSLALTGARRPPPVLALPPCQPRPPPSFTQPASGHLMVTRFRKYGSRRRPRSGRADGGAAGGWRQRRGSLAPPPRDEGKGSHVTRERVTWLSRAGEGGRGPPCRCGGVEGGGGGVPSVARCRPGGAFPWEPTPVTVAAGPDGEPGSGREVLWLPRGAGPPRAGWPGPCLDGVLSILSIHGSAVARHFCPLRALNHWQTVIK